MRVLIIVQARMGSTRLPGKVLMDCLGRPMLAHLFDRLRCVKYADQLVLATTEDRKDDPIVEFCEKNNISFFRGSENDVLSRYTHAARLNKATIIVRVTADCPLIDPEIIDEVILSFIRSPDEKLYVSNTLERTYPRGMDVEVFSIELLEEVFIKATSAYDREHVTPYMKRNEFENISLRNITNDKNLSAYRFTLDYPKDYNQIVRLISSNIPNFSLQALMSRAFELNIALHDNSVSPDFIEDYPLKNLTISSKKSLMRFGLGTAQFGMHYGRFNIEGVPSKEATNQILTNAKEFGLTAIDTAHSYGESENILGA